MTMKADGGCYCGAIRYHFAGKPRLKAECFCRACQHVSGGAANLFMIVGEEDFAWTAGTPATFTRDDLEDAVTRSFCSRCGTHMITTRPDFPGNVVLKIGTLDDPELFRGPKMAIFTGEKQTFHHTTPGVPAFEKMPG